MPSKDDSFQRDIERDLRSPRHAFSCAGQPLKNSGNCATSLIVDRVAILEPDHSASGSPIPSQREAAGILFRSEADCSKVLN